MEETISSNPKPGTRNPDGSIQGGFSPEFIKRRGDLKDKVTQLQADLYRVQTERAELERSR